SLPPEEPPDEEIQGIESSDTSPDENRNQSAMHDTKPKKAPVSKIAIPDSAPLSHSSDKIISKNRSELSDTINIHSNYCKLDNDVSDYLCAKLTPSAQCVYLRLYRQSFGWNRNWAAESLPKLKSACNLSLQTVRKAINEFEMKGCIIKKFSDYHKATVYRVFLPSEISVTNNAPQLFTIPLKSGRGSGTAYSASLSLQSQNSNTLDSRNQNSVTDGFLQDDIKNLEGQGIQSGGQISAIQSVYFSGTSIYNILESGGALPKNISKYITDIHLKNAVEAIDEFYDSIGFSVVSRAIYRKSLIDYFEIIKSGFSHDDIRYSVRWTFKNSRSRPESFSLIKHTMHLAMKDLISELKDVYGEKNVVQEKISALRNKKKMEENESSMEVSNDDIQKWFDIMDELKSQLNEHSFSAFIKPLKLILVDGVRIVLQAPSDSVSWVIDHFQEQIQETYREKTGKNIIVEVT
ncbi:MAG TPA: DnaA N-terminal domain-containing protein, partial [Desulfobacterales bacterium]|nr:DnaA N-terminal domain-containing protein [Desulfobacterales bacterium]